MSNGLASLCLITFHVGLDDALLARQHIGARRAAREHVLGDGHEATGVLQIQVLADSDDGVLDLDQIVRVLAVLAALAAPRGRRPALADNRALAQVGPYIQGRADVRYMDVPA